MCAYLALRHDLHAMDYTEKTLETQELYRGRIIYVHVDKVELPNGKQSIREIVEHPGGVAILPLDDEGNVYCVRQYRYALGTHLLELPAGKLEYGEEPLTCAVRELSEETGFTAKEMISLGAIWPSPGYCKEHIYVYLARGLQRGQAHLDAGEFLDVEKYPLEQLHEMVMSGEIEDAKTVMGILKAHHYINNN